MTEFTGYAIELENKDKIARTATAIPFRAGDFEAPDEIDPRGIIKTENQKNQGACQGKAQTSVGESCLFIATGEKAQFSAQFAYIATQKIDGLVGRDQGSTISGGVENAKKNGFCPEEIFPYPDPVRYVSNIPDGAYEAASKFKIQSHAFLTSYDDVFNYLAAGQGAVEIGISWGGFNPNREGVIESFRAGGGGHALCYLGYSKRKDRQGRNYLWLLNSHGENWGINGWAEVSPTAVDQTARHRNTVMAGMSDLTTPEPRKVDWYKQDLYM